MKPFISRREALKGVLPSLLVGWCPQFVIASPTRNYSAGKVQEAKRSVRDFITQDIARGSATGVAVAVAYDGKITWEEGFGWANRETGVRATPHTPFSLASITKPFTTTTLMTMIAEGRLTLDAPANDGLKSIKLVGDHDDALGATIRQLGAHISGLPTMYEGFNRNETAFNVNTEILLQQYGRLAYPPGICYEYSNLGFAALDAIAVHTGGEPFDAAMTRRVLQPLGMTDSFFDTDIARMSFAAARYDSSGNHLAFYKTSTPASGELYASSHDLIRFAISNMKGAPYDRSRLLDDHWLDELHRPVFLGPSGVATTFGWFTYRLKGGTPVLFKYGGQPGVATALFLFPTEGLACTVLTNRSNGRALCDKVCNSILSAYLPDWTSLEETCAPVPAAFVAEKKLAGRWHGVLLNDSAAMTVTLDISSSSATTFQLGRALSTKLSNMKLEGDAFTGLAIGNIASPDARRTQSNRLKIKLMPYEDKLFGRVLATTGDPDIRNFMLPYVLQLHRA